MAFFFFGTLMDRDVLELVLGRAPREAELAPARLHGWRRVGTAREPYPTLVRDPSGVVEGLCLRQANRRDEARIRHFEDDEYGQHWLTVHTEPGGPLPARVFLAVPELGATEEPWTLEGWRSAHKSTCLAACRQWMSEYPD